jgi:hypothetical protein
MRKFRKMGPKKNEGLRTKCYVTWSLHYPGPSNTPHRLLLIFHLKEEETEAQCDFVYLVAGKDSDPHLWRTLWRLSYHLSITWWGSPSTTDIRKRKSRLKGKEKHENLPVSWRPSMFVWWARSCPGAREVSMQNVYFPVIPYALLFVFKKPICLKLELNLLPVGMLPLWSWFRALIGCSLYFFNE